jgi:hypothetical protein
MGRRVLSWTLAYGDWPLLFVLLMVGCYFFLLPASLYMFQGKTDMYLGDGGGDPQTLAFQNNVLIQTALHRPGLMFFGAVYMPQLQAPDGLPMWVPWLERILVPTLYAFTKSAANLIVLEAWVILVLNGLCFHALARTLKWPAWLGIVASLCWAFNPYTRARVDAHMLFAATYYLPILFIGIHRAVNLSQSTRKRRDYLVAAACFLFTMFSAHYYIVATLFLSLPILVYALMTRPAGSSKVQATVYLVLATLPAVAFLGWNMLVPVPKGLLPEGIAAVPVNTDKGILYALAARPIDYLGGDLRFGVADWNPWRVGINKIITTERPHSCEPVNGIRWSIIGLAVLGLLQTIVPKVKKSLKRDDRARILALFGFTLVAFLLSVPPDFLVINGEHLGLARFAFMVLKNFRCPCRVGPTVHFGALLLAGWTLVRWTRTRPMMRVWPLRAFAALLFSAALLGDYIPTQPLILASLRPPRKTIEPKDGSGCGTGLYAPPTGAWEENTRSQEFYGTTCNLATYPPKLLLTNDNMYNFLSCSKFSWLVYAGHPSLLDNVCPRLGWERITPDSCRAPRAVNAIRPVGACVPGQ